MVPANDHIQAALDESKKKPGIDRILDQEEAIDFMNDINRHAEAESLRDLEMLAVDQEARIVQLSSYIRIQERLAQDREEHIQKLAATLELLEVELYKLRGILSTGGANET